MKQVKPEDFILKINTMTTRKDYLKKAVAFHEREMMKAHESGNHALEEHHRRHVTACTDELEVIEQNETLSKIK